MGKTICEIKMELKAKGIKGITGLNKGQLEALLRSEGSSAAPKKEPKPKAFTPAATKGESPKVAEKKITKKEKVMKPLMITYKKPNEAKKEKKELPKLKKPKQTKG